MDDSPPGVTPLDHTADVGLDVAAPDLPRLFIRSALGMDWLIRGGDRAEEAADPWAPPAAGAPASGRVPTASRSLELGAGDLASLLRQWLRELLYWHETEGLSFRDGRFEALTETRLEATATLRADERPPVREIKGVTLHGLSVERRGEEWRARVIFDV